MKQSSEDENDDARLHQELGGGEGIGRDSRFIDLGDAVWDQFAAQTIVRGPTRNHCVGISSFFLRNIIPSLI